MRPRLTDRQREILNYIEREVRTIGVPPSICQIGAAFGISSTNGVHAHLQVLEKKGYIHRSARTSCGIAALDHLRRTATRALHETVAILILGQVTAGQPILAVENRDGWIENINGIFTPPSRQRPPQRPLPVALTPGSCLPPSAPRRHQGGMRRCASPWGPSPSPRGRGHMGTWLRRSLVSTLARGHRIVASRLQVSQAAQRTV